MVFFHSTRIVKICADKMERRKKRVEVAISVEKLSIGKTEYSLERNRCLNWQTSHSYFNVTNDASVYFYGANYPMQVVLFLIDNLILLSFPFSISDKATSVA